MPATVEFQVILFCIGYRRIIANILAIRYYLDQDDTERIFEKGKVRNSFAENGMKITVKPPCNIKLAQKWHGTV